MTDPQTPAPAKKRKSPPKKQAPSPLPHGLAYHVDEPVIWLTDWDRYQTPEKRQAYFEAELHRLERDRKPVLRYIMTLEEDQMNYAIKYLFFFDSRAQTKRLFKIKMLDTATALMRDIPGFHKIVPMDVCEVTVGCGQAAPPSKQWSNGDFVTYNYNESSPDKASDMSKQRGGKYLQKLAQQGLSHYQTVKVGREPVAVDLRTAVLAIRQHGYGVVQPRWDNGPFYDRHQNILETPDNWRIVEMT